MGVTLAPSLQDPICDKTSFVLHILPLGTTDAPVHLKESVHAFQTVTTAAAAGQGCEDTRSSRLTESVVHVKTPR